MRDWKRTSSAELWAANRDRPTLGETLDGAPHEMMIAERIAAAMTAANMPIPCLTDGGCEICEMWIAHHAEIAIADIERCEHALTRPGPERARRQWGSAPTAVCLTCGAWRMVLPMVGGWHGDHSIEEWNNDDD